MRTQTFSRRGFLKLSATAGLAITLGACGPKALDETEEPVESATEAAPKDTVAPPEEIKISLQHWGNVLEGEGYEKARLAFMEKFPEIEVERIHVTSDYGEKLTASIAGGTGPDVFRVEGGWMSGLLATQGSLILLDPYLEMAGINLDEQWVPGTREYGNWNNGQYLLPVGWVNIMLAYNKDLFDADGVPYPDKTWDFEQFRDAAMRLTKRDDAGRVTQFGCQFNRAEQYVYPWIHQNDGETYDQDILPTECLLDHPDSVDALQYLADLVNVDKVAPTIADEGAGLGGFNTGVVAMANCGSWNWLQYQDEIEFNWAVTTLPTNVGEHRPTCWTGQMACNVQSKEPDAAWELLSFCTASDDGQTLISEAIAQAPVRRDLQLKIWPGICERLGVPSGTVGTDLFEANVRLRPTGPTYTKALNTVLNPAFEQIFLGLGEASVVMAEAAPEMTKILREGDD